MSAVSAAMVLAAGLGTRLAPLILECPKALVPIGDRPALAHVLDNLVGMLGGAPLVVNAHDRASRIREFALRWGAAHGRREVAVSEESELLGTAGAVERASGALGGGDVLIHNADVFANVDLAAVARAHAVGRRCATLVVTRCPMGTGTIGLDLEGRVVRLRQERVGLEASSARFLGIHVIGAELRTRLPRRGCLVGDVYVPALRSGAPLAAFVHEGSWYDIGSPAAYVAANQAWLAARGARSWVAPGVDVPSRVSLCDALVGRGARLRGDGVLERCIVWPGAQVTAPLREAVVMRDRVVEVSSGGEIT